MLMITKQDNAQSATLSSVASNEAAIVALSSLNQDLVGEIKTSLRSRS
jgi:hypothetical protein